MSTLNKELFFTVVIPLYNKAQHILHTLQSVCGQGYDKLEIIVVNDGSTDGGGAIVESYNDPRIRLISQKNEGVSAARNLGIALSSHEYVVLLDADDYMLPWHLSELASLIESNPGKGLYGVAYDVMEDGVLTRPARWGGDGFSAVIVDPLATFASCVSIVCSSSVCLNRNKFLKGRGFPVGVKIGEDVCVWLDVSMAHGMAYSSRSCSVINRDASNRSNERSEIEIPYFLSWLDELRVKNLLPLEQDRSAKKFIIKSALLTAAGYKLRGRKDGVELLLKLKTVNESILYSAFFRLIRVAPYGLVRFTKLIKTILLRVRGNPGN